MRLPHVLQAWQNVHTFSSQGAAQHCWRAIAPQLCCGKPSRLTTSLAHHLWFKWLACICKPQTTGGVALDAAACFGAQILLVQDISLAIIHAPPRTLLSQAGRAGALSKCSSCLRPEASEYYRTSCGNLIVQLPKGCPLLPDPQYAAKCCSLARHAGHHEKPDSSRNLIFGCLKTAQALTKAF